MFKYFELAKQIPSVVVGVDKPILSEVDISRLVESGNKIHAAKQPLYMLVGFVFFVCVFIPLEFLLFGVGGDVLGAIGLSLLFAFFVAFSGCAFSFVFCGVVFFLNEPTLRGGDFVGHVSGASGLLSDLDGRDCVEIRGIVSKDKAAREYVSKVNLLGRKLVKLEVHMLASWHKKFDEREACKAIAMV